MTMGEMTEAEYAQEREHWEASARTIIECGNVLEWFAGSWGKIVAGEEQNAKLLYLVATSRLFGKCMNAAIKGPSSAGKSEIRRQVLEFFPPEEVVSFTTLSEKALLYYDGDFAHKILSMGEASGVEEQTLQDYLLRELISEGRLRYPVEGRRPKPGHGHHREEWPSGLSGDNHKGGAASRKRDPDGVIGKSMTARCRR